MEDHGQAGHGEAKAKTGEEIREFFRSAGGSRQGAHLLIFLLMYNFNKVNRCLARYSPRATTTNRALNKPAWPGPN